MAALERSAIVWMGVPEPGQVVEEELPEALGDLVVLCGEFAELDHVRIVESGRSRLPPSSAPL